MTESCCKNLNYYYSHKPWCHHAHDTLSHISLATHTYMAQMAQKSACCQRFAPTHILHAYTPLAPLAARKPAPWAAFLLPCRLRSALTNALPVRAFQPSFSLKAREQGGFLSFYVLATFFVLSIDPHFSFSFLLLFLLFCPFFRCKAFFRLGGGVHRSVTHMYRYTGDSGPGHTHPIHRYTGGSGPGERLPACNK